MSLAALSLLIVLAPLVGALVAGLFGRAVGRSGAHSVTIAGVAVSTILSFVVFKAVVLDGGPGFNGPVYVWGEAGDLRLEIGFLIDELSATMMLVVSFVSLMIHVYTIGYMADDSGYQRFFSYISLFTFSMLMLVMSNNFLQLFFGWEAVGVVSYLLIGFWFKRESAIQANLKAFLVNRVGDLGFLLGIAAVGASRLDAELSRAESTPVLIAKMLSALVEIYLTTGNQSHNSLVLDIPEGDDLVVRGVEHRLVQVFQNLIDNARSFSPPDGVSACWPTGKAIGSRLPLRTMGRAYRRPNSLRCSTVSTANVRQAKNSAPTQEWVSASQSKSSKPMAARLSQKIVDRTGAVLKAPALSFDCLADRRRIVMRFFVLLGAVFAATAAWADAPKFDIPVSCVLGQECAIQQFFDHDPGPGYRDYACGSLAYDGHTGTDFRVPDLPAMRRGVAVVAAAPGRVRNTRDGMRDIDVRDIDVADLAGRDAGNAVVIVHDDGWETQYSHLRLGSVAVESGDNVVTGQPLGDIGMSGNTAFPHLEFTVRHNGDAIDPFVGSGRHEGCGAGPKALWSDAALAELKYVSSGILGAGFASAVPDWKRARTAPPSARRPCEPTRRS